MVFSQRPHLRRAACLGLLAALVLALGIPGIAAAQTPSPLDPASPNAALIKRLYDILFWSALAVFLLVEGLLLYSVIKFARKSPDEMPVQIHGNTQVEIAWTVAPAFLLLIITFLSWQTMRTTNFLPEKADIVVEAEGQQFFWVFRYPEWGISLTNEYYVPLGKTIELHLSSPAVQHAYWVPQLGGKTDLIPGRVTKQWFKPQREGVFNGQCAELCGTGHAQMIFKVHVLQPEEFEQWVAEQTGQAAAEEEITDPVELAKRVYTSSACNSCHILSEVGAAGTVGPSHEDMGATAAQRITDPNYTGGATTPEEYIRQSIVNPGAYVVEGYTNVMPSFEQTLTEAQLEALVSFLAAQ